VRDSKEISDSESVRTYDPRKLRLSFGGNEFFVNDHGQLAPVPPKKTALDEFADILVGLAGCGIPLKDLKFPQLSGVSFKDLQDIRLFPAMVDESDGGELPGLTELCGGSNEP